MLRKGKEMFNYSTIQQMLEAAQRDHDHGGEGHQSRSWFILALAATYCLLEITGSLMDLAKRGDQ